MNPILELLKHLVVPVREPEIEEIGHFLQEEQPCASAPNYPIIVKRFIPRNAWSNPGSDLKGMNGVIIHYTGSAGAKKNNVWTYLKNLGKWKTRYAGCQFIVGMDGGILQLMEVPDPTRGVAGFAAYHSGARRKNYTALALNRFHGKPNYYSIGIEVCHPDMSGRFTEASNLALARLVAWLLRTNQLKIDAVFRHFDMTGKWCPRHHVDDPLAWADLLAMIKEEYDRYD